MCGNRETYSHLESGNSESLLVFWGQKFETKQFKMLP